MIINTDRPTVTLRVQSTADRPIQIGSHYHFFRGQIQPCASICAAAYRVPARRPSCYSRCASRRGDTRLVDLVAIGGARVVYGLAGLVNGALDDPTVRSAAMIRLEVFYRSRVWLSLLSVLDMYHCDGPTEGRLRTARRHWPLGEGGARFLCRGR